MEKVKGKRARVVGLVAASLGAAMFGSSADAALMAYICDDMLCTGGGDTIVTDQGVGDNFPGSAVVGQVNSGALNINGFTIVTNVSQQIGSGATPQLNLTFSAVTSDSQAHTLFIYTSATGFTGQGMFDFQLGGNQGPAGTANTVRGRAWGGTSNTNLSISGANLIADSGVLNAMPYAFASGGAFAPVVSPYSLTIGVQVTRNSAGSSTGALNFAIAPLAVPEPGTVLLLGVGAIGLLARRRVTTRKQ